MGAIVKIERRSGRGKIWRLLAKRRKKEIIANDFDVQQGRNSHHFLEFFLKITRTYLESAHIKANKKLNEKQLYALDTLDAVLNMSNHCIRIKLNKGDIMLINDETILHDRECFVDRLDSSNIIDYFCKIKSNEICRTLGRAWVKSHNY